MNRLGHLGFSLLVLSPLLEFLSLHQVLFAVALAMLPDVDLVLRIEHRKYTHNVTFASFTAILFYPLSPFLALLAFLSVLLHIIADLMTKQKFAPLYPFSKKKFALKLFRSDNKPVNYVFFSSVSYLFCTSLSKLYLTSRNLSPWNQSSRSTSVPRLKTSFSSTMRTSEIVQKQSCRRQRE